MNPTEKARLTEAGRAEYISLMPPSDRHEIVGMTLAMSAGANIPAHKQNPLAADLLRSGTGLAAVMSALGGDIKGAITSPDLGAAIAESLRLIVLNLAATRDLEHRRLAKLFSVDDFREQSIPQQRPLSLGTVSEAGEIPAIVGSIGWASCQLQTIGGILNFSRQSVLNADWGLLASFAKEMIAAADRAERQALFSLLASNPTMSDGVQMFDVTRGNIAAVTGAPSVETLSSAITALSSLAENNAPLGLKPALLVVPSDYAASAAILLDAGLSRLIGGTESPVIHDPSLSGAWYLMADPAKRPALGLGHLANAVDPIIDRRPQFSADSIGIRVRHSFAACALAPHAIKVTI